MPRRLDRLESRIWLDGWRSEPVGSSAEGGARLLEEEETCDDEAAALEKLVRVLLGEGGRPVEASGGAIVETARRIAPEDANSTLTVAAVAVAAAASLGAAREG